MGLEMFQGWANIESSWTYQFIKVIITVQVCDRSV
jgi:hypothetical protein